MSKPIRPAELLASLGGESPDETPAVVAASAHEGAGIEREQLFERVSGDRALLRELVELFAADYPVRLRTLDAAVAAGDSAAARREAHALQGLVGNFTQGAPHRTAIEVEELASRAELTLVAAAASRLGTQLELVHRALDALLAT